MAGYWHLRDGLNIGDTVTAYWTNNNGHYSARGKLLFVGRSRARVKLTEQAQRSDYKPGREIVVLFTLSPYNRVEACMAANVEGSR